MKKKSKNNLKILALLALVAVGTAVVYNSTLSKYTSTFNLATGSGGDTGAVAGWNVGNEATTTDLFSQPANVALKIAPGTSGTKTWTIDGKKITESRGTEVAYTVKLASLTVTATPANTVKVDDKDLYSSDGPLKFSLEVKKGTDSLSADSTYTVTAGTIAELNTALTKLVSSNPISVSAAEAASHKVEIKLSWNWTTTSDVNDTAWGVEIAKQSTAPAISIKFDAVAEQTNPSY